MSRTATITNGSPCVERAERDLDRHRAAVGTFERQVEAGTHRPLRRSDGIPVAQLRVTATRPRTARASRRWRRQDRSVAGQRRRSNDWRRRSCRHGRRSAPRQGRARPPAPARSRSSVSPIGHTVRRAGSTRRDIWDLGPLSIARRPWSTAGGADRSPPFSWTTTRSCAKACGPCSKRPVRSRRRRSGDRRRGDRPHPRRCAPTWRSSTCASPMATGSRCAARCAARSEPRA